MLFLIFTIFLLLFSVKCLSFEYAFLSTEILLFSAILGMMLYFVSATLEYGIGINDWLGTGPFFPFYCGDLKWRMFRVYINPHTPPTADAGDLNGILKVVLHNLKKKTNNLLIPRGRRRRARAINAFLWDIMERCLPPPCRSWLCPEILEYSECHSPNGKSVQARGFASDGVDSLLRYEEINSMTSC